MHTRRTWRVGDSHTLFRRFTTGDITNFSSISGDTNPVHFSATAAASLGFPKGILVPGLLTQSVFSAVMACHIPGPGSIYMSQTSRFRAPIYVDDEVRYHVEITKIRPENKMYWISQKAFVGDTLVMDGEAIGQNKTCHFE